LELLVTKLILKKRLSNLELPPTNMEKKNIIDGLINPFGLMMPIILTIISLNVMIKKKKLRESLNLKKQVENQKEPQLMTMVLTEDIDGIVKLLDPKEAS
jgi:hypothetical protein